MFVKGVNHDAIYDPSSIMGFHLPFFLNCSLTCLFLSYNMSTILSVFDTSVSFETTMKMKSFILLPTRKILSKNLKVNIKVNINSCYTLYLASPLILKFCTSITV